MTITIREALINCLHKQIAALAGAQKLAYLSDMSRFLRSIRLALCLLGELLSASLDLLKNCHFEYSEKSILLFSKNSSLCSE